MSGFTDQSFVSKLSKLSDSQQSIQTLSHWVQYHKKACDDSAAVWAAWPWAIRRSWASAQASISRALPSWAPWAAGP